MHLRGTTMRTDNKRNKKAVHFETKHRPVNTVAVRKGAGVKKPTYTDRLKKKIVDNQAAIEQLTADLHGKDVEIAELSSENEKLLEKVIHYERMEGHGTWRKIQAEYKRLHDVIERKDAENKALREFVEDVAKYASHNTKAAWVTRARNILISLGGGE